MSAYSLRPTCLRAGMLGLIVFWCPACCLVPTFFPAPALLPGPDSSTPYFAAERIPTGGDAYNHAATMSALSGGELLVAWGAGSREWADDTRILAARGNGGGLATGGIASPQWSAPQVIADAAGSPDANPVLFLDDADRLHLWRAAGFGQMLCQSIILGRTSDDQGLTWSQDRLALPAICTLIRNRPIVLSAGYGGPSGAAAGGGFQTWLLPAYGQAPYQSQFFFSRDRGESWWPLSGPLLTLPFNNLQPAVVQLADGSLFALMRSAGGAGFAWQGRSCMGAVWSLTPRQDLPNPDSAIDLIRINCGYLVVAYNDSPAQRSPLVVAYSADEGRTWSPPRTLETGPGEFSYPCLVESTDGLIHCVYSDRLEAIKHVAFNRAWLESGGL